MKTSLSLAIGGGGRGRGKRRRKRGREREREKGKRAKEEKEKRRAVQQGTRRESGSVTEGKVSPGDARCVRYSHKSALFYLPKRARAPQRKTEWEGEREVSQTKGKRETDNERFYDVRGSSGVAAVSQQQR